MATYPGQIGQFRHTAAIFPTTSLVAIVWAADDRPFNRSFHLDPGGTKIYLPGGRFLIKWSLGWLTTGKTNRCNIEGRINKNGSQVQGSHGSGFCRGSANDSLAALGYCIVDSDGQGDYVEVVQRRGTDSEYGNYHSTRTFIDLIQIDESMDYAHYTDTSDAQSLADTTGGTFDVKFQTITTAGTDIKINTSNDVDITLATASTYLVISSVGWSNGNSTRNSRLIFAEIDGATVSGAYGHAYMRNSNNRFGNPNMMFIHETGPTNEIMNIKATGPVYVSGLTVISSQVSGIARQTSKSGVFIYELPKRTEWVHYVDDASSFTPQAVSPNNTEINLANVEIHKEKFLIAASGSTEFVMQKDAEMLLWANVYAHYDTSPTSTRLFREGGFLINNTFDTHGRHMSYNRGDAAATEDVFDNVWEPCGIFSLKENDIIGVELNEDDDAGWDPGNSNCETRATGNAINGMVPGFFALNLNTLSPLQDIDVFTTATSSNGLRGFTVSGSTWGVGTWAGDHGMFSIPGQTTPMYHKNNDTDIELEAISNYYSRYSEARSRTNKSGYTNSVYWYIPKTNNYNICFYKSSTKVWTNDSLQIANTGPNNVNSIGLTQGDRLSAIHPISVYNDTTQGNAALVSYFGGYKFGFHSAGGVDNEIVIFTLDDQTNISIGETNSNGFYSDNMLEIFSASIATAHSFTQSTTSNSKLYIITSNKPVVAGVLGGSDHGYQLFPMQREEDLWGVIADQGNLVVVPNRIDLGRGFATNSTHQQRVEGLDGVGISVLYDKTSISNPSEFFIGATAYFTKTKSTGIVDNAAIYRSGPNSLYSIEAFASSDSKWQLYSKKNWAPYFVFPELLDYITIVSDKDFYARIYTSDDWLAIVGRPSQLGTSGVWFYNLKYSTNPNTLEQAGRLEVYDSSDVDANPVDVTVYIEDRTTGKEYPLHGTDVHDFAYQTPNEIPDCFRDPSQPTACAAGGTGVTLYGDQGDIMNSRFLYLDMGMLLPLIAENYADPFGTNHWVLGDTETCEFAPVNC